MLALDTDTKQANTASSAETQTEFPKLDWFSLTTGTTQMERKLMLYVMTQKDRVYTSDWNGETAEESINIDMLKSIKDEIAFLRGELSPELRTNQKVIEFWLEQNSYYQNHQGRCDEFQQFDPPNSFTTEPSKSILQSANTTNVSIKIGNENTDLKALTGNGKVNTKSIKIVLVGDSIVSGIKEKGLSRNKFTAVVCAIPGATSEDMVHHTIPFAEKNSKNLTVHAGTNDIYSNIDTIGNYEKIYKYLKTNASKMGHIFSEICCREDKKKGIMNKVKALNRKIKDICKSKNLVLIRHSDINQNCLAKKKLHLHEKGISPLAITFLAIKFFVQRVTAKF